MLATLVAGFVVALIVLNSSADGHGELLRYLLFTLAVTAVRASVRLDFALVADSSAAGSAHVTAQIGLVFATFVVALIALTARADRRRPPLSWRAVATSAVARAIGAGALGVVLALAGRTTVGSGGILGSGGLTITPSAVGAFFGAFGIALVVSGLTSALVHRRRLLSPERARAAPFTWGHAVRTAVVTIVEAGVVVWTLSATVSGSGDADGVALSGSGSGHAGFGVFGALVAAVVWGLLLGVLGAPAARLCLRRAPGLARVLAGGRIHPSWANPASAVDPPSNGHDATPNGYDASSVSTYQAPPPDTYFRSAPSDPGLSAWSQWEPSLFARPNATDQAGPYLGRETATVVAEPTRDAGYSDAAPSDAGFDRGLDAPDDPFWFAVTRNTDVLEPGGGCRVAFTLEPGQWYLAMGTAGPGRPELRVILDSGLAGILYDVAEIHHAP